ncbi:SPOSA6832_04799 [Sporobolomyces salmonicolor]|uniref:SPOSA6832_04799-mRNA-1:cds n=1 Tax=Sporidiobolus salmonicolor TaxID=5005 RepID=A0A0D6ETL1_SPOSA|nr:SPOSA6832_04799 [Sporobolomyces salmonicolor]
MASYIVNALRLIAQLGSFAQILLYLPLALDIAGKECMLALSLLLTLSFALSATLHLITRNTRLKPLSTTLSFLQPLLIPAFLLLALNLYSSDSHSPTASASASFRHKLLHHTPHAPPSHPAHPTSSALVDFARHAPLYWASLLRTLSPIFVILEGLCTLLCIQRVSRFTLGRIEGSRSPDLLRMAVLIVAAGVYVGSAYFLWESYESVPDTISATLIGVAVTAILFLSGISFSIQKGNVIETSLMLAYAVFQIFHLSSRPQMYSGGLLKHVLKAPGTNGHPPLPPVVLQSLDAISSAVSQTFGAGVEFVMAASSAVPIHVLVGLFYRVAVLYAATRTVLALKRETGGYEDNRSLSEEEPAARVMTIVLAYARGLLIAVYTHLLLERHQSYWAWINIFVTIALWGIELKIGAQNDDDVGGVGAMDGGGALGAGMAKGKELWKSE